MPTTYYWAGQSISGYTGKNISVFQLDSDSDKKKVSWNNPSNWLVKESGFTSGATSETHKGENYFFYTPSTAPGGGDQVVFDRFRWENTEYPLSPCIYGGYWGTDGWLNASNTADKLDGMIITKFWGVGARGYGVDYNEMIGFDQRCDCLGVETSCAATGPHFPLDIPAVNETVYGACYRIGADYSERNTLYNASGQYGYDYTGVTMNGLKLHVKSISNKSSQTSALRLCESTVDIMMSTARRSSQYHFGGTYGQVYVDSGAGIADDVLGTRDGISSCSFHDGDTLLGGAAYYQTLFRIVDNYIVDSNRPNITGYILSGNLCSGIYSGRGRGLGANALSWNLFYGDQPANGRWIVKSDTVTIPSVIVDTDIRPILYRVDANITNCRVFPEIQRGETAAPGDGYNPVTIVPVGPSRTGDLSITNLYIEAASDGDPSRAVYSFNDISNTPYLANGWLGFGRHINGQNNLVALDHGINITNLELSDGRVVLGDGHGYSEWPAGLPVGNGWRYRDANLGETSGAHEVFIDGGLIGSPTMLDLTHPTDDTFKGVKIGPGVSHPSEDEGIRVINEDAMVSFPRDIKFVADYPAGETAGPTFSTDIVNQANFLINSLQQAGKKR